MALCACSAVYVAMSLFSSSAVVACGSWSTLQSPPRCLISAVMMSIASVSTATPASLSNMVTDSTYSGGAMSLMEMAWSSLTWACLPAKSDVLMASMPSLEKQVTWISARNLMGVAASRRRMSLIKDLRTFCGIAMLSRIPGCVMEALNASWACMKARYSGHAMWVYKSKSWTLQVCATWRRILCTALALLNLASKAGTSSGVTRRLERST
mmetsp:Transcript_7638/g.11099  ORF Transcript_7638/g.11099 Transcript_7638/m.11099 type:complete len:211 (-) Transcript_7638:473-1105(-)